MKIPTWKQLREVVDTNGVYRYLRDSPAKWRPALALALSLAKWSPERGKSQGHGECGLCELYDCSTLFAISSDCRSCPLYKKVGLGCGEDGSPWEDWLNCSQRNRKRYANAFYNLLVRLYNEEYKR
jgi:hypothetical protein